MFNALQRNKKSNILGKRMVLDQTRERGRERERERENKKNWKQQRACKTQICLSKWILKPILINEIIFWTCVRISQKRNNIIRDFLPKLEGLFSVGKYMNNAQKLEIRDSKNITIKYRVLNVYDSLIVIINHFYSIRTIPT